MRIDFLVAGTHIHLAIGIVGHDIGALATTNDFTLPLSNDPGFSALLGSIDDYDYVDRRTAIVSLTRVLRAVDVGLITVQAGVGEDVTDGGRRDGDACVARRRSGCSSNLGSRARDARLTRAPQG